MKYKTLLVVRSKIKRFLPRGMRLSKDFPEALNKKIVEIIIKASERAKENKRRTIMKKDL